MKEIKGFFDEYRFLSNFWPVNMKIGPYIFLSVEAAYQASKVTSSEDKKKFEGLTAPQAKKLGRKITIRKDWDSIKLIVMEYLCTRKFSMNPDLKDKLLATGDSYLEETNTWKDTYWGVCDGAGENHLGKILMNIRKELKLTP